LLEISDYKTIPLIYLEAELLALEIFHLTKEYFLIK
jgi:hypothetical protein